MQLDQRSYADAMVITVAEQRIDALCAVQFKDQMRGLTDAGPPRIVLDLSTVDFIDSSGLGAVVAVLKQTQPDQKLELACLSPNVEKVFRLTRMDSVFTIHTTVPDLDTFDA